MINVGLLSLNSLQSVNMFSSDVDVHPNVQPNGRLNCMIKSDGESTGRLCFSLSLTLTSAFQCVHHDCVFAGSQTKALSTVDTIVADL